MTKITGVFAVICAGALLCPASGPGGSGAGTGGSGGGGGSTGVGHNPTPTGSAEIAVSSAIAPAGGVAQVRFALTEPRPISSTGIGFRLQGFQANGVALFSATGEACGVGLVQNGILKFSAVDPSGSLGSALDYPFLTVALTVPQTAPAGTVYPFDWNPGAFLNSPSGPLSFTVKPGTITVGGSVFISGVYPGGGTYPAGTLIRVLGGGFQPNVHLQTPVKYSSVTVLPNEIDLYLKEQTTLDSQMFQVVNPDGSNTTYNAYLKGALIHQPSAALLNSAEYAFPLQTHALGSVGPLQSLPATQWIALAMQNPNPGPAVVTLQLASKPATAVPILLPSGARVVDTLTALLNGAAVQPGDTVQITSTAMIQIMGINGDDAAQTLTPFVPALL